jgi:hypothetical protein
MLDRIRNDSSFGIFIPSTSAAKIAASFFRIAEAIHHEEESLVEGGFAALEDSLGAGADQSPISPPTRPAPTGRGR